jgi:hypothetical protein
MNSNADELPIREIRELGKRLFGDRANLFYDDGICYVGKFTDDGRDADGRQRAPVARSQVVYAIGRTYKEAFQKLGIVGVKTFSYTGAPTGMTTRKGYRVVLDRRGRVRGFESDGGIFSRHFPGDARAAAAH